MKNDRQSMILEIISQENIETQEQLLVPSPGAGHHQHPGHHLPGHQADAPHQGAGGPWSVQVRRVRQPDPAEFRGEAADHLPGEHHQHRQRQNIVVIKTMPGLASAACAALDDMDVTYMVGSLAGDDTAFLVMRDTESAASFCEEIKEML